MTLPATDARKKARAPGVRAAPADDLLAWYDRHRRDLPWRAKPGRRAEPYAVWLSEIMLQQTTVRAVAPYYARFLTSWPDVHALAAAPLEDILKAWAGLGYYARARNLHACARTVVERHGGVFPDAEDALARLPGIGPYTAAAIAAIAFDRPSAPVDGNIERVMTRLHAIEEALPAAKPIVRDRVRELVPPRRAGDFVQALMDLGATVCTPKSPACALCPWIEACAARARGDMAGFPRKTPKRTGSLRRGAAFVALREDGAVLVRTRPARGLLGGMVEFPGTEWRTDFASEEALGAAPLAANWRRLPGAVTHTFTHFPLELAVHVGAVAADMPAPADTRWIGLDELADEALPNLMRKVAAHAFGGSRLPLTRAGASAKRAPSQRSRGRR